MLHNNANAYKHGGKINVYSDLADRYMQRWNYPLLTLPDTGQRYVPQDQLSAIDSAFAEIWSQTHFPFESPTIDRDAAIYSDTRQNTIMWPLLAGPVSRLRLAHSNRVTGIAQSALHGSIGKAHDIMNISAGITSEDEAAARPDESVDFIHFSDFRTAIAGLNEYSRTTIRDAMNYALLKQVCNASTDSAPEVIVEGEVRWVNSGRGRVIRPELIAVQSIATLLNNNPPSRYVAAKAFLEEFAANALIANLEIHPQATRRV